MMRPTCPNCKDKLVTPAGPTKADILLMGEFPGYNELVRGYPFVSIPERKTAGYILQSELGRVGIQMGTCRATNLWQHNKSKNCDITWHIDTAFKEIKDRKIVVVMGSDVSEILFKTKIMDVSGLILEHDAFPDVKFLMSPNPASVLHSPIGEFRLAMKRLKEIL